MSTNIVAFESSNSLPAFLAADTTGNLAALVGAGGFPVISIKGKVFHLTKNGEKTLITKPDGDGDPASSIEVVILDISPKGRLSARIFYEGKYEEGSIDKPDCYSDDGVAPAGDSVSPQASKCAACPQNVKGSGATASNPEGKACSSAKRMAIATPDNLSEPMLLRIPGASIVPLSEHLNVLKNRNVPNTFAVVTKIGFDYSVAYPALTFKPVSFVNAAQYAEAGAASQLEVTKDILGESGGVKAPAPAAVAAPVVEKPAPKAASKPAAKPVEEDDLPTAPVTKVKVAEEKPAAAPKKAAPVKEVADIEEGMDATLDDLDFDD